MDDRDRRELERICGTVLQLISMRKNYTCYYTVQYTHCRSIHFCFVQFFYCKISPPPPHTHSPCQYMGCFETAKNSNSRPPWPALLLLLLLLLLSPPSFSSALPCLSWLSNAACERAMASKISLSRSTALPARPVSSPSAATGRTTKLPFGKGDPVVRLCARHSLVACKQDYANCRNDVYESIKAGGESAKESFECKSPVSFKQYG